jgi:hypothetical protein
LHEKFKTVALGVNYGRTAYGIAEELGIDIREARHLLRLYAATYPAYFAWRRAHINGLAIPGRTYHTQLGWPYHPGHVSGSQASRKGVPARQRIRNPDRMDAQTIGNLPVQANASDWTQTVIIAATEAGLGLAAAVHDGFLLCAHKDDLRPQIKTLILIMQAAGQRLFGFRACWSRLSRKFIGRNGLILIPRAHRTVRCGISCVTRFLSMRHKPIGPFTRRNVRQNVRQNVNLISLKNHRNSKSDTPSIIRYRRYRTCRTWNDVFKQESGIRHHPTSQEATVETVCAK